MGFNTYFQDYCIWMVMYMRVSLSFFYPLYRQVQGREITSTMFSRLFLSTVPGIKTRTHLSQDHLGGLTLNEWPEEWLTSVRFVVFLLHWQNQHTGQFLFKTGLKQTDKSLMLIHLTGGSLLAHTSILALFDISHNIRTSTSWSYLTIRNFTLDKWIKLQTSSPEKAVFI